MRQSAAARPDGEQLSLTRNGPANENLLCVEAMQYQAGGTTQNSDTRHMAESWERSVEQLLLATAESNARVVAVLSPDGNSGVTTLCKHVAHSAKRAGSRTLLVDFSQQVLPASGGGWGPSDGAAQVIRSIPESYDVLEARPTMETRSLFNNLSALQHLLQDELKAYDKIIVDLPAVLDRELDHVNPVAAARASDMVVMVCLTAGTTQARVKSAVSTLEAAGVEIGGVVLNEVSNPTLGYRLAQSVRRLTWLPRGLSSRLEHKALTSEFLNSQL